MPALATKLSVRSDDFKANAAAMRVLVDDLNARLAQIALGGGEAPRAKHLARGKLLPRERVEMLLDPDTPFLEIGALAGLDLHDNAAPGGGPSPSGPFATGETTGRKPAAHSARSGAGSTPRSTP